MTEQNEEENNSTETKNDVKKNKKGFDNNERLTLRIDVDLANRYQVEKGKKKLNTLPKNLKKLNKKVRDSYDEEDEDGMDEDVIRSLRELQINQNDASNGDSTLINALSAAEKRQIMQSTNIEVTRHEENAGKQNALEQADTILRKSNMRRMNTQEFMNEMQDAIYNPSRLRRDALENNIAKQMGIKGEITKRNEGNVISGIQKVKELSGNRQIPTLNMEDVQNVGKQNMSQNATAELILRKSGQTARLTELKNQGSQSSKQKTQQSKKIDGKSYSAQMKELLKESLSKNKKAR